MSFRREEFDKIASHIKANPIGGVGYPRDEERHVIHAGDLKYLGGNICLSETTDLQGQWKRSSLLTITPFGENPIELAVIGADHPDKVEINYDPYNPIWQKEVIENLLEDMAQRL